MWVIIPIIYMRKSGIMKKENDIIFISEPSSEYIDKIIIILNKRNMNVLSEEKIIEQAEKIVYEYTIKEEQKEKKKGKKILYYGIFSFLLITLFAVLKIYVKI